MGRRLGQHRRRAAASSGQPPFTPLCSGELDALRIQDPRDPGWDEQSGLLAGKEMGQRVRPMGWAALSLVPRGF